MYKIYHLNIILLYKKHKMLIKCVVHLLKKSCQHKNIIFFFMRSCNKID